MRNEAHIIHELIAAITPHIDHRVIVDPGSTDGTQDVIRRLAVCDVPHTREWLEGDCHVHSRRLGERNRDPRR